ncbi:hypothetical protein DPMN_155396 [Dreissena polymorpha]|uniref:Uncharacterized protein n=1 Tax=Dreissena polymorpha TaxID=45954 RepID=A0A9D4FSI3_DREPO|nr:hypothetical protein DPMN_155396 [Dreissena polymorpha]
MARQRPTRAPRVEIDRIVIRDGAPGLVMGPCIVGIDRIVIREVQYQFEVNRAILGGCGLVMGPCIFEIDRIVIRAILDWCGLCRRGAPGLVMGPCIVEIDRIVIREVQYQFEVNPRRNEEIIVKGNLRWVWPVWAERPRIDRLYQFEVNRWLVMGPCIVEIDRIVIREVQYQLEVNWCRNEQVIEKAILVGAPGLVIGPCIVEIDCIVIREVQYQFEVNR